MKISLVGIGFKFLSIFLTLCIGVFSYLILFLIDDKNLFLSIFILLVLAFCLFSVYIAFSFKIILYDQFMVLHRPFKKNIDYRKIKKIYCEDDQVESSIYIELSDTKVRMSGFMVLFNKKKRVKITEKITNDIKNYIELKYPNHN